MKTPTMDLRLLRMLILVLSVTFVVATESGSKKDLYTRERWDFDDDSILELDTKAAVHRDYDKDGVERNSKNEELPCKHERISSEDAKRYENREAIENDLDNLYGERDYFEGPSSIETRDRISHQSFLVKGRSFEMEDSGPFGEKEEPLEFMEDEEYNNYLERQLIDRITVEVVAFVDSTFDNQFRTTGERDEYLSIYWNEVDIRFSSIKEMKIDVVLVGTALISPKEERVLGFTNDKVNGRNALTSFGKWVVRQQGVPGHDISVLMTSRKFEEDRDGIAYTSYVCQRYSTISYSTILISDIGKEFNTAGIAAHELGHSLGSPHDGMKESTKCPREEGDIMTPIPNFYQNMRSFYFSDCSIDRIYKNIQSGKTKCLRERATLEPTVPRVTKLPGDNPKVVNDYCTQWVTGYRSVFRPQRNCKKVYCSKTSRKGGKPKSMPYLPPVGAPCGRSKKCILGECREGRDFPF